MQPSTFRLAQETKLRMRKGGVKDDQENLLNHALLHRSVPVVKSRVDAFEAALRPPSNFFAAMQPKYSELAAHLQRLPPKLCPVKNVGERR